MQPMISRRTSVVSVSSVSMRHPTPNLQSLQGAYRGNITRLEQSAEQLSQGGSDIGEEIRKMNEVEKERDRSRQNSIQSSNHGDTGVRPIRIGSRGSRTTSYADSMGNARWGGYSPGGFVTSPVGSVNEGSWNSNGPLSGVQQSRLTQMVEHTQEGNSSESPLAPNRTSLHLQDDHASRRASRSSLANPPYADSFAPVPPMPAMEEPIFNDLVDMSATVPERPRSSDTFREAQIAFRDFDGVHFSSETEEYIELDKEGNEIRRVSARSSSGSLLDVASLLKPPRARPIPQGAPPPADGMVYYPAPVPRMLNLPKRMSQLPATSVQARKRSQMLDQLSPGARQSAPWLSQSNLTDAQMGERPVGGLGPLPEHPRPFLNERISTQNLATLPPHLRASMFFEHPAVAQDVEVKSESAVATLDSILAASATAPANAFTDHPFAGDIRKTIFAMDKPAVRSSMTLNTLAESNADRQLKKRRSSSFGNLLRRRSTDFDGAVRRPSSRASQLTDLNMDGGRLQKKRSQLSLGNDMDREDEFAVDDTQDARRSSGLIARATEANPHNEDEPADSRAAGTRHASAGDQIEEDFREEETKEDIDEDDVLFAQPSTLLAELQIRKAQQKSRNRTAATAFPNGMHSTLLELDAVEEINRRKRKNHRVALAWEDPNVRAPGEDRDGDDEDVPLGMLFPSQDGMVNRKLGDARDWTRPLGLMEKRELEDNEPLSSRRNRMLGIPPTMTAKFMQTASELHLAGQPDMPTEAGDEAEDQSESLVQRVRRLKTKDALDSAISDLAPKSGERPISTFTDDVMSQFGGGLQTKGKEPGNVGDRLSYFPDQPAVAGVEEEEEETLGQRRARLQREREVSGGTQGSADASRSTLRNSTSSLANVLANNPVGLRARSRDQEPAQGTLLHANAQMQSRQKQALLSTNLRSSSYHLDKSSVDGQSRNTRTISGGLLGPQGSRPANGGFAGGAYNQGGAAFMPSSANTPMFSMAGTNGYFASPTMGYGTGLMAFPPQQQRQVPMMNPMSYATLNGGHSNMMPAAYGMMNGYPVNPQNQFMAMNMAMGMGMSEASLESGQRDAIDRWRMSVAP